ncbi:MAG: RNA-binding S4 domain-containing protein [Verrucomicrobiales bacterium]|nr:RNA-binding S4 domain-containing protein [Verrucomicrobiales bacterium]
MKQEPTCVRIDLWLWAVRFYKTRSVAANACRKGWVKVAGQRVKPARDIRVGDEVVLRHQDIEKTVRVLSLLKRRVGAKVVAEYCEDLTPAEVYAQAAQIQKLNASADLIRDRGAGRPTKRDRRELEEVLLESEQQQQVYRQWDKGFKKNSRR